MSNNNGSEQGRIIKTQDENGEIYSFELIDVVEYEGNEYGLLALVDEDEASSNGKGEAEEETEEEVVIMRLQKADDAYTFETIEDDEEFNKIIAYLESETEEE